MIKINSLFLCYICDEKVKKKDKYLNFPIFLRKFF